MKFLISILSIISLCRFETRLFRILLAEGSLVGCFTKERVLLANGCTIVLEFSGFLLRASIGWRIFAVCPLLFSSFSTNRLICGVWFSFPFLNIAIKSSEDTFLKSIRVYVSVTASVSLTELNNLTKLSRNVGDTLPLIFLRRVFTSSRQYLADIYCVR